MNLAFIDILDRFLVVIWPMLRLSAFLAFTSIFSIRAVNIRIRICLAFALAFFVSQQVVIPKVLAVGLTMAIAGGWMINTLVDYTKNVFTRIPQLFT